MSSSIPGSSNHGNTINTTTRPLSSPATGWRGNVRTTPSTTGGGPHRSRINYRRADESPNGGDGGRLSRSLHRSTTSNSNNNNASWSFLAPPLLQNVYRQSEDGMFHGTTASDHNSPSSNRSQSSVASVSKQPAPPFLTVVLLKLESILPDYCQRIAHPNSTNTTKACEMLDSTVATATSTSTTAAALTPHASPKSPKEQQQPTASTSSPMSFKYWTSSSSKPHHNNSPSPTALVLEEEWDTFIAPFMLLAGAEYLAADLAHLRFTHSRRSQQPQSQQAPQSSSISSSFLHMATAPTVVTTTTPLMSLTGLFQRIRLDLMHTKTVLCDPFLRTPSTSIATSTGNDGTATASTRSTDAATLLLSTIERLLCVITVRCQLLELQYQIFERKNSHSSNARTTPHEYESSAQTSTTTEMDWTQAATAVTMLATTIADAQHAVVADPGNPSSEALVAADVLLITLAQELKAWKYCFESCAALGQCQFLESIASLRQWQMNLPPKTLETKLARWMHASFQKVLALLPVYFDRVHAFATPYYGFDTASLWKRVDPAAASKKDTAAAADKIDQKDWNDKVTNFLKRQERLGGPPTAVALILNAAATGNGTVERGFSISSSAPLMTRISSSNPQNNQESNEASSSSQSKDGSLAWPAVYLRSTLHLPTSSSSSSVRSSPHSSGALRSSQGSLLSGWSSATIDSPTIQHLGGRKQYLPKGTPTVMVHQSVFEYAPDTGNMSWPHSDWNSLVLLLRRDYDFAVEPGLSGSRRKGSARSLSFQDSRALTYRYDDENDATEAMETLSTVDEMAALFRLNRNDPTNHLRSTDRFLKTEGRQSSFHLVSLNRWLTLTVMVRDKEEEESRWHRRRNRLDDGEIRAFLNELGQNLSITSIFSSSFLTPILKTEKNDSTLSLPCDSSEVWNNDLRLDEFRLQMKTAFGLRPIGLQESTRAYSFYGSGGYAAPRTPRNRKVVSRLQRLSQSPRSPPTSLPDSAAALFLGQELVHLL